MTNNRDELYRHTISLQDAKDQVKEWQEIVDVEKAWIKNNMGPNRIEDFPDIAVSTFEHERRAVVMERLRGEYPDIAEICTEVTTHIRVETHRKKKPKPQK